MKITDDAQMVIYRQEGRNIFFLLLCRFNPERGVDEYRLVKGGVEKDESIENAAKREIEEEVGLKDAQIILKVHEYSYTAGEIHHNVQVLLVKTLGENIDIDSSEEGKFEIKGYRWELTEKALDLLSYEDEKKSIINSLEKINLYNQ